MSKKNEIMQAVADLAKAMAILKENQEAIEQKLESMGPVTVSVEEINKAFDRNKGWGTITGNVELTNYHNSQNTSVPVTIEDLEALKLMNRQIPLKLLVLESFLKKYLP